MLSRPKLYSTPDDIMNLKRQRRVPRRLRFFHFHINYKYRLNQGGFDSV